MMNTSIALHHMIMQVWFWLFLLNYLFHNKILNEHINQNNEIFSCIKIILAGQPKQTRLYINWLTYLNLLTALHVTNLFEISKWKSIVTAKYFLPCKHFSATVLFYSGTFNIKCHFTIHLHILNLITQILYEEQKPTLT